MWSNDPVTKVTKPVALPQILQAGAVVDSSYGGGRLVIAPGMVVLELGPLMRRATKRDRVAHGKKRLVMFKRRLLPPWMNTSLLIEGDVVAYATVAGWNRGLLRDAIPAARYELDECSTLIFRGLDQVFPS